MGKNPKEVPSRGDKPGEVPGGSQGGSIGGRADAWMYRRPEGSEAPPRKEGRGFPPAVEKYRRDALKLQNLQKGRLDGETYREYRKPESSSTGGDQHFESGTMEAHVDALTVQMKELNDKISNLRADYQQFNEVGAKLDYNQRVVARYRTSLAPIIEREKGHQEEIGRLTPLAKHSEDYRTLLDSSVSQKEACERAREALTTEWVKRRGVSQEGYRLEPGEKLESALSKEEESHKLRQVELNERKANLDTAWEKYQQECAMLQDQLKASGGPNVSVPETGVRRRPSLEDNRRQAMYEKPPTEDSVSNRSSTKLGWELLKTVGNAFQPGDNPYASFHTTLSIIEHQARSEETKQIIRTLRATDQPSSAIVKASLEHPAPDNERGSTLRPLGQNKLCANDHVKVTVNEPGPSGLGTLRAEYVIYGSDYDAINQAVAGLHSGGNTDDTRGDQVSYW